MYYPLLAGFALDLIFGDPRGMPHIIRAYGHLISFGEEFLRKAFPSTPRGERAAGAALVALVAGAGTLVPLACVALLRKISPPASFAAETLICFQLLCVRSLRDESEAVYKCLMKGDLPAARKALSMIVGRDTERLDETGVIKAAVETVAENTSDGIVAPLFWIGLFGFAGGCFCKAVNTMDSMVGYKNEKYRHFGTCAAKLDDIVNFIPARLAGLLIVAAAAICRYDPRNAMRIFLRDRLKHESPNSAHTEAACAGALRVQLAGPASYGGVMEDKHFLGDPLRPVEKYDIRRSHNIMYAASALALALSLAASCALG